MSFKDQPMDQLLSFVVFGVVMMRDLFFWKIRKLGLISLIILVMGNLTLWRFFHSPVAYVIGIIRNLVTSIIIINVEHAQSSGLVLYAE